MALHSASAASRLTRGHAGLGAASLPQSQLSPTSTMPMPQASVEVRDSLQPSPGLRLLSSHTSPASRTPSPQLTTAPPPARHTPAPTPVVVHRSLSAIASHAANAAGA